MFKKFAVIIVLAVLFAACTGKDEAGTLAGTNLVLYTWSEMFPQEILDGFEQETGIKIQYVNFDTNETMIARLMSENGGSYDLIIADDYMAENVINEGLAQKIDTSRLSNYKTINPLYQKQFYDPDDEYTIPYGAGIQTIVYDPKLVDIPIRGYADLWNTKLVNSLGIVDQFRVINGMALKVMGQSYNTNDLEVIQAAGDYLKALAPNIRLIRDDDLQDELLSGEISVAVMYTSQVTMAKMEKPELAVVYPEEGLGFGIMPAFIPINAPNSDAAYAFLNYILDAENGARCFEYLGYYSTFAGSDPYIEDEYKDFLTIPKDFNIDSMEMIENISEEAADLHNRLYTEFKSRAGR